MANPISEKLKIGTIGELLVQLRLLQYGVQAAPPLKDSGNDLIALRGKVCRLLQVKTTTKERFDIPRRERIYDILAVVHLAGEGCEIRLDGSAVFLIPKEKVSILSRTLDGLRDFELNGDTINCLFSETDTTQQAIV